MKKFLRTIFIVLALALCLTVAAAAATAGENLSAFEDIADMTTYTFSDLDTGEWYYSGIKTAYDKGILLGFEDGTYRPDTLVNWSQAIAIAARLHSVYNGTPLVTDAQPGQPWYYPYLQYCDANGILPSSCPRDRSLSNVIISRYDLAYLFSRCVSKVDMPAISNREISDIDSIPAYYLDSVRTMYAAGIMTGYADYSFGGSIATSRAHISLVVARLLEPSQRIGYDSKVNEEMADFEANLENDSVLVELDGMYYCVYRYFETPTTERYAFYRTDGSGRNFKIYLAEIGEYINNVYAEDGMVYFCVSSTGSENGKLMCYDTANGKVSTVYNGLVESYCFYNGRLYALIMSAYAEKPEGYKFAFGRIENEQFSSILTELSYSEVMYFQPYGWNDCIYFKLHDEDNVTKLYFYDIKNDFYDVCCDYNINTSFFVGHVMYFMMYDEENNYDTNLYAISVQTPGALEVVGEFPGACANRYRSIYIYDDEIYCLASFSKNIYRMDRNGSARMALMCGGVYNAMNFTADKLIIIPSTLVTSNVNEIKMYSAATLSSRTLFGDWLGMSCYYVGARFAPDEGTPLYHSDETISTVSNIDISVTEAFMRDGELVLRTKYQNNGTDTVKLRKYIVKVYVDGQLVAYDINNMVSSEMKQYDIQTYTFVITGEDLANGFKLTEENISKLEFEIVPTFSKVVIEDSSTADEAAQNIVDEAKNIDTGEISSDIVHGADDVLNNTDPSSVISNLLGGK